MKKRATKTPTLSVYVNGAELKACTDLKLSLPEPEKTPHIYAAEFSIPKSQ